MQKFEIIVARDVTDYCWAVDTKRAVNKARNIYGAGASVKDFTGLTYKNSIADFQQKESDAFGGALKQLNDYDSETFLDWRIRRTDKVICIIQYNARGKGYDIYAILPNIIT